MFPVFGAGFGGAGRAAGGGGGGLCFVSASQNQWLNSVSGAAAKVSESDGHLQENPKNSVLTSDKSAGDLCCVLLNSGLRILLRSMA